MTTYSGARAGSRVSWAYGEHEDVAEDMVEHVVEHVVEVGQTDPPMGDAARARGTGRVRLVGREAEMTSWAGSLAGRPRGLVLHGVAGSGKTRLAEELVERAERAGFATRFVRGRATMEDLPLGPFASLLPSAVERAEGVSLLVLARDAIAALGRDRPLVLGVDDLHLLDATSAALVHQLVAGGSVVLVGTVREGEWAPDAITDLWRAGHVDRWRIGDLDASSTTALAEALLGGELSPQLADEVVRLSGGNPLFVTTLVRAVSEAGGASAAAEQLELGAAAAESTLVDFVTARLGALDPGARDALAVVALAEPIGLQPLERMTDERSLVELERGGWLEVIDHGRRTEVRLAHPLYGEVLRHSVSRLLARSIHRELTQTVLGYGARRRDDLLRVATWSVESGMPLAPDRALAAALEAAAAGDLTLSVRHAEAAWDAAPSFVTGYLLLYLHDSPRYLDDREGFLAALGRFADSPRKVAGIAITRSFEACWRDRDVASALQLIAEAATVATGGTSRAELDAQRASCLALSGEVEAARELVAAASAHPSSRVRVTGQFAAWTVARDRGDGSLLPGEGATRLDPTALAAAYEQMAAAVATVTDHVGLLPPAAMLSSCAGAFVVAGAVAEAERIARIPLEDALPSVRYAGMPETTLAWVLFWRGRVGEGYEWARRAAVVQRRYAFGTLEVWSRSVMAACAAVAGRTAQAEAALAEVDRLGDTPLVGVAHPAWMARAGIALRRGDAAACREHAAAGLAHALRHGLVLDEAMARQSLAQLGDAAAQVEPTAHLAARVGGLLVPIAIHIEGLAARDAEMIAHAAAVFESAGAVGLASIAWGTAARTFAAAGSARDAARCTRQMLLVREELDIVEELFEVPTLEPLSRREREVAVLAAAGLPSRAIADRLFLSTFTVDNHLASVYDKLGVHSRAELAEALPTAR